MRTKRLKRVRTVHMLKERKGNEYATMCGERFESRKRETVPITVWHCDVTCFDCLNRGLSYDND